MGIYDRPYAREESGPTRPTGPQTMVGKLIAINVIIYLLTYVFGITQLVEWMQARSRYAMQPIFWYTFLTYGFAHAQVIGHILGNMFVLFMFGRDVETVYGSSRFLRIYIIAIVLGGAAWTFWTYMFGDETLPMVGASGAVTAVVILFCFHFPKRTVYLMFVLPIPAWVLGVFFVSMDALGMFGKTDTSVAYQVHLMGAAWAAVYYRFGDTIDQFLPRFGKTSGGARSWPSRSKLKVFRPNSELHHLEQHADRILAKLHREGEDSLTPKERRILESYSRQVREQRGK